MIRSETFEEARTLRRKMFPLPELTPDNNARLMMKLIEEVGEVAGEMNSYFGRKYRPEIVSGNIEGLKGEFGDILFVLVGLADLWQLSPDECLQMVTEKLQGRFELTVAV